MRAEPFGDEGEKDKPILAEEAELELVVLGFVLFIRRDAIAAVDGASAVGTLHVQGILGVGALAVVVIEERNVRIVALDEASARRVIVRGGERQTGVFGKLPDLLDQPLAEGVLTENPGAIVILKGPSNDLSGGCGIWVH